MLSKDSYKIHQFNNDVTRLIRLYVDGLISEEEYKSNLSFICDNYRHFRKDLFNA